MIKRYDIRLKYCDDMKDIIYQIAEVEEGGYVRYSDYIQEKLRRENLELHLLKLESYIDKSIPII